MKALTACLYCNKKKECPDSVKRARPLVEKKGKVQALPFFNFTALNRL